MGELSEPWDSKQVELLDRHLQLLHLYSQAKQNLENQKGKLTIQYLSLNSDIGCTLFQCNIY